MRPLRNHISNKSLILMGVPKKFCNKNISDFNTYNDKGLKEVKKFVINYINTLEYNIENNRGIFFYGANGVGKSMLSCIILKEVYRHRYSCRRVTFSAYINAYTESWNTNNRADRDHFENELYEKYKGVEFLVLEEIGKEIDSKIAKPILEDLLRYREEHGLVTIICCNMHPNDFRKYYEKSICSIINGTQTIINIVGKDKRQEVFNNEI